MAALVLWGLLLSTPLSAGARDGAGYHSGQSAHDGGHITARQEMMTSRQRLIESAMSHVSVVETNLMEVRTRGNRVEIVAAENSLREAETLLTSLMAQAAGVPVVTITTMHSSGTPFSQIGYDLGVFERHAGDVGIDGHAMGAVPAQDLDIRSITMSGDIGTDHHAGAYHDGGVGNNGNVRVVVTEDYRTRGWDDHHGVVENVSYPAYSGSMQYRGNINHYNSGGGMGGMH